MCDRASQTTLLEAELTSKMTTVSIRETLDTGLYLHKSHKRLKSFFSVFAQ